MEKKFKKDVADSLNRLAWFLVEKVKSSNLSPEQRAQGMTYLNHLKIVASNASAYCNPEYFVVNAKKMGFDVDTPFPLYNLDEKVAKCIYDILVCRRDYIYFGDKQLLKNDKFNSYRYKSRQEAIEAMRLLKRDSIMLTGGFVVNWARSLLYRVCEHTK